MAIGYSGLLNPQQLQLMSFIGFIFVSVLALFLMWRYVKTKSQTIVGLEYELHTIQQELQRAQQAYTDMNQQYLLSQQQREKTEAKLIALEDEHRLTQELLTKTQTHQLQVTQELSSYRERVAELTTTAELQRSHHQEQLEQMKSARDRFSAEFQSLADRLLSEKVQSFDQQQRVGLEKVLVPLHEQLVGFKQHVDNMHESDMRDRASLRAELGLLKTLNQQMSTDAVNLTKALKGEQKTQGMWGEVILERVLERSGLRQGFEYQVQSAYKSSEGKRLIPDVVIEMPDNRQVIVDAKVSLTAYERACQKTDNVDAYQHEIKAHLNSLKGHISQLSEKSYEHIDSIRTLEFVLLFVPIDAAYLSALHADHTLFDYAYRHNIILTCPTTLLSALKTIDAMWKQERQNENVKTIVKQAGLLHDQCCLFLESFQELGDQLEKAQGSYSKTLERLIHGRGNVVRRIDHLRELGAKTKKQMPASFMSLSSMNTSPSNLGAEERGVSKSNLSNEKQPFNDTSVRPNKINAFEES